MVLNDIEIIMFPAKSGDCIFIDFKTENFKVLIDGGYSCTYDQCLGPFMKKIAECGAKLDLIIVTHIDRDHINGIKKFLSENGDVSDPKIIPVKEIWFNGFRNMPIKELSTGIEIPYTERGCLQNMAAGNNENKWGDNEQVSFREGNCLAEIISDNGYSWNTRFTKAVVAEEKPYIDYGKIKISILNPTMKDLDNLAQCWINELKKTCKHIIISDNHLFDRAFEGCFIYDNEYGGYSENVSFRSDDEIINWKIEAEKEDDPQDRSVQNLSSIAVLLEYEGTSLLFPGDCPMFKIKDKLPHMLDVVKLPHHGSGKSTDKEFIRSSKVDYYLLSTDGSHGHPSKKVIGNIVSYAKESMIVANYSIPLLEELAFVEERQIFHEH